MSKPYTVTIGFADKEAMLEWAARLDPELALYHADSMDREFSGSVPSRAFVVRARGAKPDEFLAERKRIGAEA